MVLLPRARGGFSSHVGGFVALPLRVGFGVVGSPSIEWRFDFNVNVALIQVVPRLRVAQARAPRGSAGAGIASCGYRRTDG